MERVGIRELKQNASQVVARVEAGESLVVTVHNRDVAILTRIVGGSGALLDDIDPLYDIADPLWAEQIEANREEEGSIGDASR